MSAPLAGICADFEPYRIRQAAPGWTPAELAARIGVPAYRVQHWQTGVDRPTRYELSKLAEVTGYPPAFFRRGRPMAQLDSAEVHVCHRSERAS